MSTLPKQPKILVISSHVAHGHVGNAALTFSLQRLGAEIWDVPTIILPFHPGHGPGTKIIPSPDDFAGLLNDLVERPDFGSLDAVLSGYLAHPGQASAIAETVRLLKKQNPQAVYCCDPVLGDETPNGEGRLYVAEDVAVAIRDQLVPIADIVAPNRFELTWLTGEGASDNAGLAKLARALGRPLSLVTSAYEMMRGRAASLAISKDAVLMAEGMAVPEPPHGLGDLMAGLFLFHHLMERQNDEALRRAMASVHDLAGLTKRYGRQEMPLAAEHHRLMNSSSAIQVRKLLV